MAKHTLEEIVAWWQEIERLERKGAAIDIISFAETAHEYIPTLIAELARRQAPVPLTRNDSVRPEIELTRQVG